MVMATVQPLYSQLKHVSAGYSRLPFAFVVQVCLYQYGDCHKVLMLCLCCKEVSILHVVFHEQGLIQDLEWGGG